MSERREELIEKSLEYFLENGAAGLSLRPLAAAIGTSARLLIYHFGSKDGLIAAVMEELRARLQQSFSNLLTTSRGGRRRSPLQAFWSWMIQEENVRFLRLLFEVQVLALRNPSRYAHDLEGTSTSWLKLIESALPPSRDQRAMATLCVAVVDGLLMEYMSTGDAMRTTRALKLFDQLIDQDPRV